jgi:hypothetical protein
MLRRCLKRQYDRQDRRHGVHAARQPGTFSLIGLSVGPTNIFPDIATSPPPANKLQSASFAMFSLFKKETPSKPFVPFDFDRNPYKAKKIWPPAFDQLSHKDQFRLERRYRRRSKLKWARPIWNRNLALVQWFSCITVVGYAAFYMPWEGADDNKYLMNLRRWYNSLADSIWTKSSQDIRQQHLPAIRGDENAKDQE